ncbi:unnamed protein product [Heligmosomoides polygyrus]|uniref:Integrase_H2C2 domain-containing protein n=1 Tax=Heligmosomoides polygyrus TaxID=6339 RepID=A0A183G085_HELPZ|nr:unnamed protein product [Heligmosomoides polygyrus]
MLQRNTTYMEKYHDISEDQLKKGIIEPVKNEDESPVQVHYLAHRGVISVSKKHAKARCVFDGSAKKEGLPSLSNLLHKGPNLPYLHSIRTMPILISVILFRLAQLEIRASPDLCNHFGMFACKQTNLHLVHTRINNSSLPEETINPNFPSREGFTTALFVQHIHQKNHHYGTEQTLIELRKSVWIPKRRTTMKYIINKLCFLCKRLKARLFKLPDFPTHLTVRVNTPNFFENTGVDIKTFLQSLRRFTATNGCPKLIVSDSAPTFKVFSNTQMEENSPSEGQFKNENREKKNENNHHMIIRAKAKQQHHQNNRQTPAMNTIKKTKMI